MKSSRFRLIALFVASLALLLVVAHSTAQAGGLGVTPTSGLIGTTFQFDGTGFAANEKVSLWINKPDGSVAGQGYTQADGTGAVSFTVTPATGWLYGTYSQVAHGTHSQYEVYITFDLRAPESSGGGGGGSTAFCPGGNFRASGFASNERGSTWTTRPDGQSLALPDASADQSGLITFTFVPEAGWPVGQYIVVAQGRSSHYQGVNTFNWDGANLTGGPSCDSTGAPTDNGTTTTSSPGNSGGGTVIAPNNIVNPQGAGIYLNNQADALYYADCDHKWWGMIGGTPIYIIGLGFTPGETVKWYAQDLLTGKRSSTYTLAADGAGNVSVTYITAGVPLDHQHLWFTGQSSGKSFCGHFDLTAQP